MIQFGPKYFEDKAPNAETAQAAIDAKAKGYKIVYPLAFLQRFKYEAPLATPVSFIAESSNSKKSVIKL